MQLINQFQKKILFYKWIEVNNEGTPNTKSILYFFYNSKVTNNFTLNEMNSVHIGFLKYFAHNVGIKIIGNDLRIPYLFFWGDYASMALSGRLLVRRESTRFSSILTKGNSLLEFSNRYRSFWRMETHCFSFPLGLVHFEEGKPYFCFPLGFVHFDSLRGFSIIWVPT